ncbi:hypothetical protein [Pseudonocardia acaciae]|uniref:hypothetical protein n=1 Tax=Pseudonocardia acaciae TaxID=551276 RepID=UPI00048CF795|nr:hypothetical protein [Pseudonocardia acaciae]
MTAWLSVLVPLLVMFFALGMERVEARMRESAVRQDELDDFLERARADEVKALFRSGTGRALELFRLRNRDGRQPRAERRATAERRQRVAS